MRHIAGKVMMDRNAPDYLLDTAQSSYDESEALINKWHKNGRLLYAITPRFAPTSTPRQLKLAGELKKKYPDTYVHTHLSENKNEIAWAMSLFPERKNYLDVYDYYGLTSDRTVFAHSIHFEDSEFEVLITPDPQLLFARHQTCFWVVVFFAFMMQKIRALKLEWARISARAQASRCSPLLMKPTK
jgi:guanine deaminase